MTKRKNRRHRRRRDSGRAELVDRHDVYAHARCRDSGERIGWLNVPGAPAENLADLYARARWEQFETVTCHAAHDYPSPATLRRHLEAEIATRREHREEAAREMAAEGDTADLGDRAGALVTAFLRGPRTGTYIGDGQPMLWVPPVATAPPASLDSTTPNDLA